MSPRWCFNGISLLKSCVVCVMEKEHFQSICLKKILNQPKATCVCGTKIFACSVVHVLLCHYI